MERPNRSRDKTLALVAPFVLGNAVAVLATQITIIIITIAVLCVWPPGSPIFWACEGRAMGDLQLGVTTVNWPTTLYVCEWMVVGRGLGMCCLYLLSFRRNIAERISKSNWYQNDSPK